MNTVTAPAAAKHARSPSHEIRGERLLSEVQRDRIVFVTVEGHKVHGYTRLSRRDGSESTLHQWTADAKGAWRIAAAIDLAADKADAAVRPAAAEVLAQRHRDKRRAERHEAKLRARGEPPESYLATMASGATAPAAEGA
jgi:hypothetical protein